MFDKHSRLVGILYLSIITSAVSVSYGNGLRTWTDSSGKYTVEAELVSQSDGQIILKSSDGKIRRVAKNRLCRKDLDYLSGQRTAASTRHAGPLDQLVGRRIELSGLTLDGKRVDLQDFEGKVVLIDFWATWCGPCIKEMPNIAENYRKYHSSGFEVIAVSLDQDMGRLSQFVKSEKTPWTVLADQHPSNSRSIASRFGIATIPAFILVGEDGTVIDVNCRGERLGQRLAGILGR